MLFNNNTKHYIKTILFKNTYDTKICFVLGSTYPDPPRQDPPPPGGESSPPISPERGGGKLKMAGYNKYGASCHCLVCMAMLWLVAAHTTQPNPTQPNLPMPISRNGALFVAVTKLCGRNNSATWGGKMPAKMNHKQLEVE